MCFANIVITSWIRTIRQIIFIVAIEMRDVAGLFIIINMKVFVCVVDYFEVFLGLEFGHSIGTTVVIVWMIYPGKLSVLYLNISFFGRGGEL